MTPFYWNVPTLESAKDMVLMLAAYDQFQYETGVKPDYANMGGLQEWNEEAQEWWDWESETGETIDEWEPTNG